jgi:hypothetical protein
MATRREDIGLLSLLTGDDKLARFGTVTLEDEQRNAALRQRQSEFDYQKQQPTNLGNGFLRDPTTGRITRDPQFGQYDEDEQRRALERIDAQEQVQQRREQRQQNKISGPELANLAALDSQLQLGRDSLAALEKNPGAKRPWTDSGISAARSVPVVGNAFGNLIESGVKSNEERDALNKMRRFIAGIRHSELGSALTGYELQKGAEWDPTADGINSQESKQRLENLLDYLEDKYETIRAGRPLPDYSGGDPQPREAQRGATEQQWEIGNDGKPVRVR